MPETPPLTTTDALPMPSADGASVLPAGPAVARRGLLLVAPGGVTALGPLSVDMYLPALPDIALDLQGSASAVNLSLTAFMIGMAAGQLFIGPLSDELGRRLPLLVGLSGFAVASLACALAPSVWVLVAFRLLQGLLGAAGVVIARAVVRDVYDGVAVVRFFSRLILVTGLAPVIAPPAGAQLLQITTWHGIFGSSVAALGVFVALARETERLG